MPSRRGRHWQLALPETRRAKMIRLILRVCRQRQIRYRLNCQILELKQDMACQACRSWARILALTGISWILMRLHNCLRMLQSKSRISLCFRYWRSQRSESRAQSPEILVERPSITLSSFKPSKDTVRTLGDETLSIRLAPGEVSHVLFQSELVLMESATCYYRPVSDLCSEGPDNCYGLDFTAVQSFV